MKKNPTVYLNEMIESIERIADYIKDMSFSSFEKNFAIQDAVLRRLQLMAEAAKRVDEVTKQKNADIPWKKINGLRNTITHEYDEIDLQSIWDTATIDLPPLKSQIKKLRNIIGQ